MSSYNYSIISDTSNALLNSNVLQTSISSSTITPSVVSIDTSGDTLIVRFDSTLTSEEQSILTALVNAHDGTPTPEESKPTEVKIVEEVASAPFAAKTLSNGQKLFKRVHGVTSTIAANSTGTIQLAVPYAQAKINALEILGASHGDTANFNVYDNAVGSVSSTLAATGYTAIPNLKLNQFGFDVVMRKDFHMEESQYDADVIQGMVLELEFTNNTNDVVLIGANFILHEIV